MKWIASAFLITACLSHYAYGFNLVTMLMMGLTVLLSSVYLTYRILVRQADSQDPLNIICLVLFFFGSTYVAAAPGIKWQGVGLFIGVLALGAYHVVLLGNHSKG